MNRANNDNQTHPMGSDTVNQPKGYVGNQPQHSFDKVGDVTSQPMAGEASSDIVGFAEINQISRFTGEPLPNQNWQSSQDVAGTFRKTAEDIDKDADTRFTYVDTMKAHNKPIGSNTIGGFYSSDPFAENPAKTEKKYPVPDKDASAIDTTGISNVDNGTEKPLTTTSEDRKNLYNEQYPSTTNSQTSVPEEQQTHGNELANQMAGGVNPGDQSLPPSKAKHTVTEKEMYYVENTGQVKPREKLGQSYDARHAAVESAGETASDTAAQKGLTTEKESDYVKDTTGYGVSDTA